MTIRVARLKDTPALLEISLEQAERMSRMRPDKRKIQGLITECISSSASYAIVLEDSGEIKGCLLAIVGDNLWAERKFAAVLLWVSTIPRMGARMMRRFVVWYRKRPGIRVAGLSPDFEWDLRIHYVLVRAGFVPHGGSYLIYN